MNKFVIYYKISGKLGMVHTEELLDEGHLNRRNITRLRITDEFTSLVQLRSRKLKIWLRDKQVTEYRISEAVD
jgi:hypothetical protein